MVMLFIYYILVCLLSIICTIFAVRLFLHRTALIYVVRKWCEWLEDRVHVHQHFKVPELNESTHQENQFYRRVSIYVNSLANSLEDSDFTNLISGRKPNDIVLSLDDGQAIHDVFLGARVSWINDVRRDDMGVSSRTFMLKIMKKDKRRILRPYLQHIHTVCDDIEQRRKELRIHSHGKNGKWRSVPFNHPATFDSLVIDPDLKSKIKHDLETFLKSRQYYHKLGRVWKRSYLLYGPSGTGKSSFIAATANTLNYDVYNVDLSQLENEANLNTILLQTTSKSLIVVEDLDRHLSQRSVTSSSLLNFMDGVLNFQDERIMIFTMNGKDGIDPALLRPGRVDMHIYFPLCDFNSFKNLANNYLGVKEHKLFPQVEEIFLTGATMSPAEISELMLANRSSPSRALKSVISALQSNGRSGGKVASRLSDSVASSPAAAASVVEEGGGATAWKETVPKEFRKLYGLLRMKSCKRPGSLDHDSEMMEQ